MHRVYGSMLVTDLYNRIAGRILLCDATNINLLVKQDHLWHSGSITDRINPLTRQPTCFLAPRTVVTVRITSPYPHVIRPEGPLVEHLVNGDVSDEGPGRNRGLQPNAMEEDEELYALYRELSEIKAKILFRWAALFASDVPSNVSFRSQRDDDTDDGDRHDLGSHVSRRASGSSSIVDLVNNESAPSSKRSHQQDETTEKLNSESNSRRASNRPVVKLPMKEAVGAGWQGKTMSRRS